MPEIADVVPGETIASVWGNEIRDRTLQRYANAADRDASNPSPSAGDLAYLQDLAEVQVWAGADWIAVSHNPQVRSAAPSVAMTDADGYVLLDTFVVSDPGRLVQPVAAVTGETRQPGSGPQRLTYRVDVSLDGGATWTQGDPMETGMGLINATNMRDVTTVVQPGPLGVPTGSVHLRLMGSVGNPGTSTTMKVAWSVTL